MYCGFYAVEELERLVIYVNISSLVNMVTTGK